MIKIFLFTPIQYFEPQWPVYGCIQTERIEMLIEKGYPPGHKSRLSHIFILTSAEFLNLLP